MYDVCPLLPDVAQEYGCTTYTFEVPWSGCASGRFHAGIDLWDSANPNNQGQPVYATRSGIIYKLGFETTIEGHDFGPNAICLLCDDGTYLWYGHLSQAFVTDGDRVTVGEVIGAIGSLGVSTGPHLHFEARNNFPIPTDATEVVLGSIDPTPYLSFAQNPPVNKGDIMPAEVLACKASQPDDLCPINTNVDLIFVQARHKDGAAATGRIVVVGYDGKPATYHDYSVSNGSLDEWRVPDGLVGVVVWQNNAGGDVTVFVKQGTK